jgi:hypothetical protein
MKKSIVEQCLDILKTNGIKKELELLSSSLMNYILYEMKPFIFIFCVFVFTMFIMNLAILIILIILLKNKQQPLYTFNI